MSYWPYERRAKDAIHTQNPSISRVCQYRWLVSAAATRTWYIEIRPVSELVHPSQLPVLHSPFGHNCLPQALQFGEKKKKRKKAPSCAQAFKKKKHADTRLTIAWRQGEETSRRPAALLTCGCDWPSTPPSILQATRPSLASHPFVMVSGVFVSVVSEHGEFSSASESVPLPTCHLLWESEIGEVENQSSGVGRNRPQLHTGWRKG